MLGPFATASRLTPTHQVSLPALSRAAKKHEKCFIDVHDDNDNA